MTAWDAAVFPSAGEKARTDPAEPSTPTTSLWPFVHSPTFPCNPIEPSCGTEVSATVAPVPALERISELPAAAVTWEPRARSVPSPKATSMVVPAARLAVKISVVRLLTPALIKVVELPIPLARLSRTTSLPPWTTKLVAVLFALASRTRPAPVLRMVPPAVPVPLPVLVTWPL